MAPKILTIGDCTIERPVVSYFELFPTKAQSAQKKDDWSLPSCDLSVYVGDRHNFKLRHYSKTRLVLLFKCLHNPDHVLTLPSFPVLWYT